MLIKMRVNNAGALFERFPISRAEFQADQILYFSTSACAGWYVGGSGAITGDARHLVEPRASQAGEDNLAACWACYLKLIPCCRWLLISASLRFRLLAHSVFRKIGAAAKMNKNVTISTTLMLFPILSLETFKSPKF